VLINQSCNTTSRGVGEYGVTVEWWLTGENRTNQTKVCSSATSARNLALSHPWFNCGHRNATPASSYLSYGTASNSVWLLPTGVTTTKLRGKVFGTITSYSWSPGLKFNHEIDYPDWGISWFSSVPQDKCRNLPQIRKRLCTSSDLVGIKYFDVNITTSRRSDSFQMTGHNKCVTDCRHKRTLQKVIIKQQWWKLFPRVGNIF
jgi:hypothetical protein